MGKFVTKKERGEQCKRLSYNEHQDSPTISAYVNPDYAHAFYDTDVSCAAFKDKIIVSMWSRDHKRFFDGVVTLVNGTLKLEERSHL